MRPPEGGLFVAFGGTPTGTRSDFYWSPSPGTHRSHRSMHNVHISPRDLVYVPGGPDFLQTLLTVDHQDEVGFRFE